MAIAVTHLLTNSTTTDATSFTTASFTPAANALILAAVHMGSASAGPTVTSLTGNGLTWVQVAVTGAATARDLYVFRAMGPAPTAGALTINMSASVGACLWSLAQFTGVDTSGTNGSGAIVGSTIASPTSASSVSVTMNPAPTAGNAVFGAIAPGAQVTAMTAGSGYTLLGSTSQSAPTNSLFTEYANTALTAITGSWTTAAVSRVVGVEVKAAPAGGGTAINGVHVGANLPSAVYVGSSAASAIYVGGTKVWP